MHLTILVLSRSEQASCKAQSTTRTCFLRSGLSYRYDHVRFKGDAHPLSSIDRVLSVVAADLFPEEAPFIDHSTELVGPSASCRWSLC